MCGLSKKHEWKRETWWWNDKVKEAVKKKQECFKWHIALAKAGHTREAETQKQPTTGRNVSQSAWSDRPSLWLREKKILKIVPKDTWIFKLARQMDKTNQDVVGEK